MFVAFKPPHPISVFEIGKTFLIGLHLDFFVALVLTLPLFVWLAIVPTRWLGMTWHRFLLRAGLLLFWTLQLFGLVTEFYFFQEFNARFNTVAVDYLLYPYEVFINIWDSYPVVPAILACLGAATALLIAGKKYFNQIGITLPGFKSRLQQLGALVALAVMLSFTISFKEARFSHDRVLNEMANNGAVSFVAAALTRELDFAAFYRTLPSNEANTKARELLSEPNTEFAAGSDRFQKRVGGDPARPRLNVVILLEESLGSEFWGCLGRPGQTLMPEMDKLAAAEGMLFANIYASGNRTVRGLEGVLCSFPPLPGDSIVVRNHSANVETIARVLKRDGYATEFLYGGRGIFDGMRSFALRNGFDKFVELKDFSHPTFTTIWGVCDEDLYHKAIEEFRSLSAAGKPFFATALSVSNHKPFTYPPGRIPEDPSKRKRRNAVKYADYALGQFFQEAKKESFYTNTIFVVVADHGARVYGSQNIPMHSYEIPFLVVGPAVVKQPERISRCGCSLDVGPTILGLLGRPYDSLFFGQDMLRDSPGHARALLNHNRDIGLFKDDHLVVLGLNKTVEFYHGNPKTDQLRKAIQPDALDAKLERDAIALFQTADELYTSGNYLVRSQRK